MPEMSMQPPRPAVSWWPWVLAAVILAGLIYAGYVWSGGNPHPPGRAVSNSGALDDNSPQPSLVAIAANPKAYYGSTVADKGQIASMVGLYALWLSGDGQHVLTTLPNPSPLLKAGDQIQVKGIVRAPGDLAGVRVGRVLPQNVQGQVSHAPFFLQATTNPAVLHAASITEAAQYEPAANGNGAGALPAPTTAGARQPAAGQGAPTAPVLSLPQPGAVPAAPASKAGSANPEDLSAGARGVGTRPPFRRLGGGLTQGALNSQVSP